MIRTDVRTLRARTAMFDEKTLSRIEERHQGGLTSAEILDLFVRHGVQLSEATLRKYVQLGLLPRSRRVGRKGKHQGSKGVYPVGVVRQIARIKELVASNLSIQEIQRRFLFVRSDIEQLEQTLDSIFQTLDRVTRERKGEAYAQVVSRDLGEAKQLATGLMDRLVVIEGKLSGRQEVSCVAAS